MGKTVFAEDNLEAEYYYIHNLDFIVFNLCIFT